MENFLLIITNSPGDFREIINTSTKSHNVVWLQLWPAANTRVIEKEFHNVEVVKSIDFISNEDHFRIADEVTTISQNWWLLLGLDKYGEEWNINGLKITQIFSYEIEQVLTNIMFSILSVNRAIKKFGIDEILFIDKINEELQSNEFSNDSLFHFYQRYFAKDKVKYIFLSKTINNKLKKYLSKLKKICSMDYNLLLRKVKRKIIKTKITENSIFISNSDRCLLKFIEVAIKKKQVFIINDCAYFPLKTDSIRLKCLSEQVFFDGVSLSPFFKKILPMVENKFYNLKNYYNKTKEYIELKAPFIYITHNIANSIELVKLWAYKQAGVRTVYTAEDVSQEDEQFDVVLNSVLHREIDIERWVTSSFYFKHHKNSKRDIITGYLGNINKNHIIKSSKRRKKTIVFALSMANKFVKRAIVSEDMFEILQSVYDVANVVSEFSECELIIKLHPGDENNIPLYKEAIENLFNVKIVAFGNLNKIISNSDLVIIYETSVGLESLFKRKNVIIYNYTQRPTYTHSVYDYLNHNPEEGAALKMVHTKDELRNAIKETLPYGTNTKPCPNLEYVLENARDGYDVKNIVSTLIENE